MIETVARTVPIASASLYITGVFEELDRRKIQYCSWKSASNLEAGLSGKADIDLLAEKTQVCQLETVLHQHGFKRAYLPGTASEPGIEDWIGCDPASGTFYHLHLHYQIYAGLRGVEEYRLPWEQIILGSRIKHQGKKVWTADPNLVIVILAIRMALKTNGIENFWCLLKRKKFLGDMLQELNWLRARSDRSEVRSYAVKLLGENAGESLTAAIFVERGGNRFALHAWRQRIRAQLGPYCRHGLIALKLRRLGFAGNIVRQKLLRYLGVRSRRKRLHSGGGIVAIIGADGAGKSTIARHLTKSLAWKLDAHYYYLGEGRGSFAAASIGRFRKIAKRILGPLLAGHKAKGKSSVRTPSQAIETQRPAARILGLAKEHAFALGRIIIVWERQRKLHTLQRARTNGSIVVTDRYPQSCVSGFFDGPRYGETIQQRHLLSRFAARKEREFFESARRMGPDLVVRLHVSEDVACARKPGHARETIRRKIAAMPHIHFADTKQIDIDTAAALADVKLKVQSWVWDNL